MSFYFSFLFYYRRPSVLEVGWKQYFTPEIKIGTTVWSGQECDFLPRRRHVNNHIDLCSNLPGTNGKQDRRKRNVVIREVPEHRSVESKRNALIVFKRSRDSLYTLTNILIIGFSISSI